MTASVEDIWDDLDEELSEAAELFAEADDPVGYAEARNALLDALDEVGFDVDDADDLEADDLEDLPAHWLLLYGDGNEDDYRVLVIPETAIDDDARRALERADGKVVSFGETCVDEEDLWNAWVVLGLGSGGAEVEDFEDDLELREENGLDVPSDDRLEALEGVWDDYLAITDDEDFDSARLNVKLVGLTHLRVAE